MKFIMISKCGEGAHLLWKIQEEGNKVRIYIEQPEDRSNWRGILPQVVAPTVERDEIAIFDTSGMGTIADQLKKSGYKVFGGSGFCDKLEKDREFGLNMMRKCGIQVPETKNFTDWKVAIAFIEGNPDTKYVFKPSGANLPSKLSYVPFDSEDLISYLKFVQKAHGKHIQEFVLQEFVEGTIISTEFWCDGNQFVHYPNHTIEVKKFMDKELGPSTGCAGNIVWKCDYNAIVEKGILKAQKIFVDNNYIGPVDLNSIITDDDLYGLEWTPRFGYDAMPTLLQLVRGDLANVISDFVEGDGFLNLDDDIAGGIRLSIPPYPMEPPNTKDVERVSPNKGMPIHGLESKYKDNYYFFEVMKDDKEMCHSGGTGAIAVISSTGDTVESALKLPYEILENIKIPDKQYRTDLSDVLLKMYNEVKELEEIYA